MIHWGSITTAVAVTAGILIWVFTHLENIEVLWGGILKFFSWVNKKVRLKAINTQIQSKINIVAESIEAEVEGVMPYPLKIEWLEGEDEFASLENNEVVIRLRNNFNDAMNLVTATLLYLQTGFLRQSRPHTYLSLQNAIDLEVTWKILNTSEETNVGYYFLNEVYNPIISENDEIEIFGRKLKAIEAQGWLTRLYFRELRVLGKKVFADLPNNETKQETKNFLDFLNTITISEKGAHYPLNFLGKQIRVGILLVANLETLAMSGLRSHKYWLKNKVQMGLETIYICSIGDNNVDLARSVAYWGQQEGFVDIVRTNNFLVPTISGKSLKSIVITCHSSQAQKEFILSPEEEIQATLARHIPEVAIGDIEIIDIARSVGMQTKVVYRWAVETAKEKINFIDELYHEKFKEIFDEVQEPIYMVQWSNDIKNFIIDCLAIPGENVVSVIIDENNRHASITVNKGIIAARAVGSKGSNVRLTEEITGYNIQITCDYETDLQSRHLEPKTPEDDLREKIRKQIPEFNKGEIEILALLREEGVQSKIVVKSNNHIDVLKCCLGKENNNVKMLNKLLGERVYFVKWEDDQEKFLINCLGISEFKVIKIEYDFVDSYANVVVKDSRTAAMAIGENGINVKQAAKLFNIHNLNIYTQEEYEIDE